MAMNDTVPMWTDVENEDWQKAETVRDGAEAI